MAVLDLVPQQLPYPIRGGIIRGIRTFIAILLAAVSASILDGSLLNAVQIVPKEYWPAATTALTTLFVSVDKWFRERGLVADIEAEEADVPTSGPVTPTTDDVPAEAPLDDGVDPTEFDDDKV